MNKRRNFRIPLRLSGELAIDGQSNYLIETRDVSLTGVWLDYAPRESEINKHCILTLFISDEGQPSAATFRGRIAYSGGQGCGFQFLAADDKDFRLYVQQLREYAPAAETIWAEYEQGFVPSTEDWAVI